MKKKLVLLFIISICFIACNDTDDPNDAVAENITYQIDNEPLVVITDGIDAFLENGVFCISAGEIYTPAGFGIQFLDNSPHEFSLLYGPGITPDPVMINDLQFNVSHYGPPGEYVDVTFSTDFVGTDFTTWHHISGTVHVLRDN